MYANSVIILRCTEYMLNESIKKIGLFRNPENYHTSFLTLPSAIPKTSAPPIRFRGDHNPSPTLSFPSKLCYPFSHPNALSPLKQEIVDTDVRETMRNRDAFWSSPYARAV